MPMTEKCKIQKKVSRTYQGLAPLTQEVKKIVQPILKKHGFVSADILTYWTDIVGEDLALGVLPDKLVFKGNDRTNGTLVVKSAGGAFALLFQHKKDYIVQKINTFFGYPAVKNIRIKQGMLPLKMPTCFSETNELKPEDKQELMEKVSIVQDKEMQDILFNIGCLLKKKS